MAGAGSSFGRLREVLPPQPGGQITLPADDVRDAAAGSRRILLLATLFGMPYRVLRCACAAGARVWVCGTQGARGLRHSRHCRAFMPAHRPIAGSFDVALAEQLNSHIERLGIDTVLAGDAPSTRTLIAIRERLRAPCFPMPSLEQFDHLNNKWNFTQLCTALGMLCPPTRVFPDTQTLARELRASFQGPCVAKPLSMDGGLGVVRLDPDKVLQRLDAITYRPILIQDFIEGIDIGASALCRDGEVTHFIAHRLQGHVYSAFFDEAIHRDISRIVRQLRVTGVLNFDMRLTSDGRVFFLECNPRLYWKIAMSMLAGINFIAAGLSDRAHQVPARLAQPVNIRYPKALLRALPTPWKLDTASLRALKFLYSDPVPHLREQWGLESDAGRQYSGASASASPSPAPAAAPTSLPPVPEQPSFDRAAEIASASTAAVPVKCQSRQASVLQRL